MKNKLILVGFTILAAALCVSIFLFLKEKSARELADSKYAEEKKEALRQLTDSLNSVFDGKVVEFQMEIEELSNQEQQINYIPYEKLRYVDRNVDTALDTISNYTYKE